MVHRIVGVSFIDGISKSLLVLQIWVKIVVCRTSNDLDCLHLHCVLAIDKHNLLPVSLTGTTQPVMHPRVYGRWTMDTSNSSL